MHYRCLIIFISFLFQSYCSYGKAFVKPRLKAIYGTDDRIEIDRAQDHEILAARATAAMFPRSKITYVLDNKMALLTLTPYDNRFYFGSDFPVSDIPLCEDTPFIDQKVGSECSGFLIADDLLVTAGHCIENQEDCENNVWVFDYTSSKSTKNSSTFMVASHLVYGCQEVLTTQQNPDWQMDYAIIKLERKIKDRKPLQFRTAGTLEKGERIYAVGYPSGLPAKIARQGVVLTESLELSRKLGILTTDDRLKEFNFKATLDTFGGNSGSPVINASTGLVEGILVSGETDYEYRPDQKCVGLYHCQDDECQGEGVTRVSAFLSELEGLKSSSDAEEKLILATEDTGKK